MNAVTRQKNRFEALQNARPDGNLPDWSAGSKEIVLLAGRDPRGLTTTAQYDNALALNINSTEFWSNGARRLPIDISAETEIKPVS
jgi:hypothetical protein